MYSPLLGQFAQRDPLGYAAGDENLYRYCNNEPTDRTDPRGCDDQPSTVKYTVDGKKIKSQATKPLIDVTATDGAPVFSFEEFSNSVVLRCTRPGNPPTVLRAPKVAAFKDLQTPLYNQPAGSLGGLTPDEFKITDGADVQISFVAKDPNAECYKWVQVARNYLRASALNVSLEAWHVDNPSKGANGLDYEKQSWKDGILNMRDVPNGGAGMGLKPFDLKGRDAYGSKHTPQEALNQDKTISRLLKNPGDSFELVLTFRTYLFKVESSAVPLGYYAWSVVVPISRNNQGNIQLGTTRVIEKPFASAGTFEIPKIEDYGPEITNPHK